MSRKTANISRLKEMANGVLLHTADDNKQGREAIQTFIECVLMEAGQYNGFRYLTKKDMWNSENGISFGINPSDDSNHSQFEGSDHTRVEYL